MELSGKVIKFECHFVSLVVTEKYTAFPLQIIIIILEGILFHSRYSNVLELFQAERGKNTFHPNQEGPIKRSFLLPQQQRQVQQLHQPHHKP